MSNQCLDLRCSLCTFPLNGPDPIVDSGAAVMALHAGCWPNCKHVNLARAGLHASCFALARPKTPLDNLGAIVRHDLRPERGSTLGDVRHATEQVALALEKCYQFPGEVCAEIAHYLVVPYIVMTALSIQNRKESESQVFLDMDIWARFVKVHGRIYIASVSNTNRETRRAAGFCVLIYRPGKTKLSSIHIAKDAWGILKMRFTNEMGYAPRKGVWWHTVAVPPGMRCLMTKTDGTKLRSACRKGQRSGSICTSSPNMGDVTLLVWKSSSNIALTPFRINDKGVKGYYAGIDTNLVEVRADVAGQEPVIFANEPSYAEPYHRELDWFYFPVSPGDFVSQVWLRHSRQEPRRTALMLHMDSGDEIVLGEHRMYNGRPSPYTYEVLIETGNKPRTLFLELSDGLDGVAYAGDRGIVGPPSWLPSRIRKDRYLNTRGLLFYTKTTLKLATEIRLCQDDTRITGLVFHFADETRGYVGRLDEVKLQRPIRVTEQGIWIQSELNGEYPFISKVTVARPTNAHDYLHVQWKGIIRWWASRTQCEVRYGGGRTKAAV
ncbi:hypothetical protein PWT90_06594 [Aphanocladium album]|nr:hypothetical protein PWT90_06594 [Aphanocladium album]